MNILNLFKTKKQKIDRGRSIIVFNEEEQLKIENIITNSKLDFLFINEYARDLFVYTANLFNDEISNMQFQFINKATKDIDNTIDNLINMGF